MREFQVEVTKGANVPDDGTWRELHSDKTIKEAVSCEYGFAEEVVSLLEYDDGTYEVGIGESLRPYIHLYTGDDRATAYACWWTAVQVRSMFGEPTEFEDEFPSSGHVHPEYMPCNVMCPAHKDHAETHGD